MPQNNSGSGKHDAEQIKADKAAIDDGICPETGVSLKGVNIAAHVAHVFPQYPGNVDPTSDYARRARMLLATVGKAKE